MQRLLILLFAIVAIEAGTRRANPGEEEKALALWAKHCQGEKEGGTEGSIFIHCKHPLGVETHTLSSSVSASGGQGTNREQYIFIQPPQLHFSHDISVLGGAALEPKTIVYVKPAKTSHSYQANLRIAEGDHKKPELVFLSSAGAGSGSSTIVDQQQGQQGTAPEPIARQVSKRETEDAKEDPVKITESYSVVRQEQGKARKNWQ